LLITETNFCITNQNSTSNYFLYEDRPIRSVWYWPKKARWLLYIIV